MSKSNISVEKQEFELLVANLFQKAGGLPSDYQLANGTDPPDVFAERKGSKIGIELRRLYADENAIAGSSQRQHLSVCRKVVAKAAELHSALSNQWYNVVVSFNPNCKIGKTQVQPLANDLVALVTGLTLQYGEVIDLSAEDFLEKNWPEEVHGLLVGLLEGTDPPFWSLSYAFWWSKTDFDLIQKGLNSKEDRSLLIKEQADEAWLLLVIDGSVGVSLLDFHVDLRTNVYQSSFDRAFVLSPTGKDFVELKIQRG